MKRRIEILVDAEIPDERFEEFRKSMEDAAWAMARTWHNVTITEFVQANEVPLEGKTWLHLPEDKSSSLRS
jgi:hypothetical protein